MKTTTKVVNRFVTMKAAALAALAFATLASTPAMARDNDNDGDDFAFDLVRSNGLTNSPAAVPNAHGRVKIESVGPVEIMKVKVWGLPPNTDFDFFVIQVPNAPFGEAWYQGDIETNRNGVGYGEFIGRFNIETFIVSNGDKVPAPADPFHDPNRIPDAIESKAINPIQIYHLGLWFNSPKDAVKAGAPPNVTPFNGEHNAGVQVLNTGEFAPTDGPLKRVTTSGN
jgi:hypothetical protein